MNLDLLHIWNFLLISGCWGSHQQQGNRPEQDDRVRCEGAQFWFRRFRGGERSERLSQGQAHPPVGRTQAQRRDQEEQAHGKERPWIPQGPTKNAVTLILLLCCQEIPRAVLFNLKKPHYRANFTLSTDLKTIYCLKTTCSRDFNIRP